MHCLARPTLTLIRASNSRLQTELDGWVERTAPQSATVFYLVHCCSQRRHRRRSLEDLSKVALTIV